MQIVLGLMFFDCLFALAVEAPGAVFLFLKKFRFNIVISLLPFFQICDLCLNGFVGKLFLLLIVSSNNAVQPNPAGKNILQNSNY